MDRRGLLRMLAGAGLAAACGPGTPVAAPSAAPPSSPGSPSPAAPRVAPSTEAAGPSPAAAPEPAAGQPSPLVVAVICRDAWGARAATGDYRPHTVSRLTVHHSAAVLGDNARAPGHFRQHQRFHQESGWPDIAYHYGVDRRGNVYELRPTSAAGDTFTDYDPAGHFLVLAEGDFNQEQPTDAQLEAVATMLAFGAMAFGVALDTVSGHRDWAATSCPGDHLYPLLPALRDRAADLGGVTSSSSCGAEGRERVAAIERGEA